MTVDFGEQHKRNNNDILINFAMTNVIFSSAILWCLDNIKNNDWYLSNQPSTWDSKILKEYANDYCKYPSSIKSDKFFYFKNKDDALKFKLIFK